MQEHEDYADYSKPRRRHAWTLVEIAILVLIVLGLLPLVAIAVVVLLIIASGGMQY